MSPSDGRPIEADEYQIDQRLDAIDRALLGMLPRNDRLATVTQIEKCVREFSATGEANPLPVNESILASQVLLPAGRFRTLSNGRKRSRLAFSAGVFGILAIVLLFATPFTYVAISFLAAIVGELVALTVLGVNVVACAIFGFAAVVMGVAALVTLRRRNDRLIGNGWAVTGLCTGLLPMFIGGLTTLLVGSQLLTTESITITSNELTSSSPTYLAESKHRATGPPGPLP